VGVLFGLTSAGAQSPAPEAKVTYWNCTKDEVTEREVLPQRLVHYRENYVCELHGSSE
jgi:hypothetical protein